jgi:hypothetical protein
MTHSFEEPLHSPNAESDSPGARILPFQRPPTDLQRAIQMRAQQAIELDHERERDRSKGAPVRWAIIFVLALIPVGIVFSGIDAFVRIFHHINDTYSNMPVPEAEPAAQPAEMSVQQPGIVILQPLPDDDTAQTPNGGE